jgi:hypothetical protein
MSLWDDISPDVKEILVYVAGYLSFKYCNCEILDTRFEYEAYRNYFDSIDRGRLTVPSDCIVTFVYYAYLSFICNQEELQLPCHNVMMTYCREIDAKYGLLHTNTESATISRSFCNILFNNYTKSISSNGNKEPVIKLAKLSSSASV